MARPNTGLLTGGKLIPERDIDSPAGIPALILGSYYTALGTLRLLAAAGIRAYCLTPQLEFVQASRFYAPPPGGENFLQEPKDLAHYLEELDLGRGVLFPCSDEWVHAIAALDSATLSRFPASLPPQSALNCFLDKGQLEPMLETNAVPRPRTHVLAGETDLPAADDPIYESAFLKPRHSRPFFTQYGIKALSVGSRAEAAMRLGEYMSNGHQMMLQEYLPGPADSHYFIDGFIDRNGVRTALLTRQRMRMYPLDFGDSSFFTSIPADDIADTSEALTRLLNSLDFRGIFSAEFVKDPRDHVLKLIEVNTRPWAYVQFAFDCGANVAYMAYRDALEQDVQPAGPSPAGISMVVMPNDINAGLTERRRGRAGLVSLLRDWMQAKSVLYTPQDSGPWRKRWRQIIGSKLGR